MAITSDRLLTGVKRRISMPASQVLLQDTDILAFADDIIKDNIIPLIQSLNQDYFVTTHDETLVAGTSEYPIPYRSIGRALRELKMTDGSGAKRNLVLLQLENSQAYYQASDAIGFYFKSDKVRLVPDVPSPLQGDVSLEMWYLLPPNSLVALSSAAEVTAVNGAVVTVASVPSAIVAGSVIDFIQGKSGSSIYAMDKTVTNVAGTQITFGASVVPSSLTAGDYIALAQQSPVINFIPNEAYPLVESLAAKRCLEAIGDYEAAGLVNATIADQERNLKLILEPRITGEPTITVNPYSLARRGKVSRGRFISP